MEAPTVDAFHLAGCRFEMIPFGRESGGRTAATDRCGDCGAVRGGWHHPGCDIQRCPACGSQLLSCDCRFDEDGLDGLVDTEPWGVDGNGCLVERAWIGGAEVIIHRDDVPESDITTVAGIRVTTALRTVIDLATELDGAEVEMMVHDALDRGLFTVDDARRRLAQPDMATRRGADLLRRVLPRDC